MNISQIRYFMAVVETGNFTKAAERANISQPTLSAGIKRLEEDLGAPLFERGRGAALTPSGARFLPRARVMLQEWTAARRELRQAKPARQRLRLGHMTGLPLRSLASLLGGFSSAQPDVALETLEAPAATLQRRLDLGRLDAALLLLPEADAASSSLTLFRQRYHLAVPAKHPLAHRSNARIAELHDQAFVIHPDAAVMPTAEKLFAEHNARPRIVGKAESDAALLSLVEAGLGAAILPHWLCASSERIGSLVLAELKLSHRIGLAWRGEAGPALALLTSFAASHAWDRSEAMIGH
jgi:DNA-binding transcriptional LysR family regulator